nr:insulinase family protein [uncultured Flavobacterium sp.]
MDLVFFAGNCYEEKNWVAAATNFLLKNGTHKRTAFELNDHFEFYGAYVNRTCYNETATINLHTLSKHFEALLPVVSELVTEANFPEEELKIYQQNQIQRLTLNLKKSDFIANRLIDEYLFGINHPYGTYSTEAAFNNLTREDLVKYYDRFYKHGKAVVFMAGKFPKNMQSLMNQYIGSLPLNQQTLPTYEHPILSATTKKYSIVNDASSVQGSIRMARRFPNRHHPDFPATQVLNNLFGGELLARMDRAASITARRHSRRICVTASVNHVAFNRAIPLGSVVTVESKVSRTFNTSMEIFIDVWIEDRESGIKNKANEAIYTFVAVDETGRPIPVPPIIPETDLEKQRYDAALRRKQLSLVLAGKMKPNEATELKALFTE